MFLIITYFPLFPLLPWSSMCLHHFGEGSRHSLDEQTTLHHTWNRICGDRALIPTWLPEQKKRGKSFLLLLSELWPSQDITDHSWINQEQLILPFSNRVDVLILSCSSVFQCWREEYQQLLSLPYDAIDVWKNNPKWCKWVTSRLRFLLEYYGEECPRHNSNSNDGECQIYFKVI